MKTADFSGYLSGDEYGFYVGNSSYGSMISKERFDKGEFFGTGRTDKNYWYYYDDSTDKFIEYGGTEITKEQFCLFEGASDILSIIDGQIYNILYRANGIININFINEADGFTNDDIWYECSNILVGYDNGSVWTIDDQHTDYAPDYRSPIYSGLYLPAVNPDMAVYPSFTEPTIYTDPLSGLPETLDLAVGKGSEHITLNKENVKLELSDTGIAEIGGGVWVDTTGITDFTIIPRSQGETVLTATSPDGEVLKCKINVTAGISIVINGNKITPQYEPIIVNDTTLVHIRTFENIGATVDWNQETQTATVKKGNRTVSATIGGWDLNIEHNNGKGKMPVGLVPIQSVGQGYTMVPLRAITEAMGGVVNWIEDTRTVDIYYSDMIDYILNNIDTDTDTDIFDINTVDTRKIFSDYEYCYDYMDKYYEDDFWQAFSIAFDDPTMPIKTLIESMYDLSLWDYKGSKNIDLSEVYTKNNVAECLAEAIDSLTDEDIDLYSVNNEVKTVISKISSVTGLVLEENSDLEGLKVFSKVLKGMSDSIKVINTTSDVLESALADYAVSETYLEAFENALNDTELKNDVLDDTVAQLKIEYNAWYADKLSELVSKTVSGKVTGGIAKAIGKGSYNFVNFVREYLNIVSNNDDRAKLLKKINAYMIYSLPLSRCYKYYADKIYDGDYLTYDVLQCEKLFDLSKATRIQEYKNVLSLDKIDRTYDKSKPTRYNEDLGKSEEEILDIGITLLENIKYLK